MEDGGVNFRFTYSAQNQCAYSSYLNPFYSLGQRVGLIQKKVTVTESGSVGDKSRKRQTSSTILYDELIMNEIVNQNKNSQIEY